MTQMDTICMGCLCPVWAKDGIWLKKCQRGCGQTVQCYREGCLGTDASHTCGICNSRPVCKDGEKYVCDYLYCRTCKIAVCETCFTGCVSCSERAGPACPRCKPGPLNERKFCTVCALDEEEVKDCPKCNDKTYRIECEYPGCYTFVCPHTTGYCSELRLCLKHKRKTPIQPPGNKTSPVCK